MSINKGVAWYDISGSGWVRDLWVLMHWPYSAWHLSYVVIGAALAPVMNWPLLAWTVLAFALGMVIAGHALDELNGRPLKTSLPGWLLWLLTGLGVAGAAFIGVFFGMQETLWLGPCILFGAFIVVAYNLEWCKGFFHRDEWFGVAWGAFPVITAYLAQTHTLSWSAIMVALFALLYSMAQRKLSMQSRFWRRKVFAVGGWYILKTGEPTAKQLGQHDIIGPVDLTLKYMNAAIVVVAIGLLIM